MPTSEPSRQDYWDAASIILGELAQNSRFYNEEIKQRRRDLAFRLEQYGRRPE